MRNARAGETLQVIRDVLADVAQNGLTDDELDDAVAYLTGSFALQLSTNAAIASMLVTMQLDDLGPAYIEERNDFIAAVTSEDVKRVAARLLDPANLLVVVSGQPEGIEVVLRDEGKRHHFRPASAGQRPPDRPTGLVRCAALPHLPSGRHL